MFFHIVISHDISFLNCYHSPIASKFLILHISVFNSPSHIHTLIVYSTLLRINTYLILPESTPLSFGINISSNNLSILLFQADFPIKGYSGDKAFLYAHTFTITHTACLLSDKVHTYCLARWYLYSLKVAGITYSNSLQCHLHAKPYGSCGNASSYVNCITVFLKKSQFFKISKKKS